MLVQVLLLTGIFLVGSVYVFAVRPLMDFPSLDPPDPRETTLEAVREVIWQQTVSGLPPEAMARAIVRDPVYRAAAGRNPDLRYSITAGDTVIGTPRLYRRFDLDRIARAKRGTSRDICAQLDQIVREPAGWGYILFIDCDGVQSYEVSGLVQPIDLHVPPKWRTYARLFWNYSRSFLLPALAVFVICMAILAGHIVMIRRIARLIRPLDGGAAVSRLPERGLPTEVLPLVHAVNRGIAHVADVEQRQRFFLSAAAHEMRTPLTVLRTRLEMIEPEPLKDKLVADVRRLTRLVNELLTLMSVRERARPLDAMDLVAACRRVISALEPVAIDRGVTMRLDAVPMTVTGDAALIDVALSNLVGNALAFSPEGGRVTITVGGDRSVSVSDQGGGVAEEQIGLLFEPFVRFSKTPGGHGLGLTIVKAIADLHGARIAVARGSDGGAVFTLEFPAPAA
ncbi:sensor histidine kinase [Sphingomonas sp. CLY1604]|uniref:sensor histidine kinase n=1 Tax=Sphingomonas sp. CLY1604 TaxID=3457786 RepID=UPI003FD7F01B